MFRNIGRYTGGLLLAQIQFPEFGQFDPNNIGNVFMVLQQNIDRLQQFAQGVGSAFGDIGFISNLARTRGDFDRVQRMNETLINLANQMIATYGIETFATMLMQDRGFQQLFLPVISQTREFDRIMDVYERNVTERAKRFTERLEKERQKLESQGITPDTAFRFEQLTPEQQFVQQLDTRIKEINQRIQNYRANIGRLVEVQIRDLEFGIIQQDINLRAETEFINQNISQIRDITARRIQLGSVKQLINLDVQMERFSQNIRENINRAITGQFNIRGLTTNLRFIDPLLLGFAQDTLSPNQLFSTLSNTYGRLLRMVNEMNRVSFTFGNIQIPNIAGIYSQMINIFQKSFGVLPSWATDPQLLETMIAYDLLSGNDINRSLQNVNKVVENQLNRLSKVASQLGINFETLDIENLNIQNLVKGFNEITKQTEIQNRRFTQRVLSQLDFSDLQEFWNAQGLTLLPDFQINLRTFTQNPIKTLTDFGKQLLQAPKMLEGLSDYLNLGISLGLVSVEEADKTFKTSLSSIVNNFDKLPEAVRLDTETFEKLYILAKAYNIDTTAMERSYKQGFNRYTQVFRQLDDSLRGDGLDEKLLGYQTGLGQVQSVNISAQSVIIKSG